MAEKMRSVLPKTVEYHDVFGNLVILDRDPITGSLVERDIGHSTEADRLKEITKNKGRASYETVMNWFIKLGCGEG